MPVSSIIDYSKDVTFQTRDDIKPRCQEFASAQGWPTADGPAAALVLPDENLLNDSPSFPPTRAKFHHDLPQSVSNFRPGLLQLQDVPERRPSYRVPTPEVFGDDDIDSVFDDRFNEAHNTEHRQMRLDLIRKPRWFPSGDLKDGSIVSTDWSFFYIKQMPSGHCFVNWLLDGGPTINVIINRQHRENFVDIMKNVIAEDRIRNGETGHKWQDATTDAFGTCFIIPSLSFLRDNGIGYHLMKQNKGEIGIFPPDTIYFGLNTTAVYFEYGFFQTPASRGPHGRQQTEDTAMPDSLENPLLQEHSQDGNISQASSSFGHLPASQDDVDHGLDTSSMNGDSVTSVTERDADVDRGVRERVQRALDSGDATKRFWANRVKEAWPHI